MTDQNPQHNRRLSVRKRPRGQAKVACYRGAMDVGNNLALALVEVSEEGARLAVRDELPPRQEVTLVLQGQGHLRPVRVTAAVVWCRAEGDGRFLAGVRFDRRLAYSDLLNLT
jgi:hypothetical protein